jgi:hypothetical protein
MNKLLASIFLILTLISGTQSNLTNETNGCISFIVGQGTGCNWICNYCSTQLSTNNYYFTDGVCTYQTGGCVDNPIAGKEYTCCTVSKINQEL